jgi:two-component system, OmpR family, response regulator
MKILAIDDTLDILELLDTVLTPKGHQITQADNGRDGLKLIKEQQFDIVFLDLYMPGFSGIDVVKALANEGIIKKQKVMVLTATEINDAEVKMLLKNGVHACLRKPIVMEELLSHINEASSA